MALPNTFATDANVPDGAPSPIGEGWGGAIIIATATHAAAATHHILVMSARLRGADGWSSAGCAPVLPVAAGAMPRCSISRLTLSKSPLGGVGL